MRMIKCELDMCKNNKKGLCNLEEISIKKSYDNEMGYFIGGECSNYKSKQSYLDEESERTFKLMKISEGTYYAVRRDVYDDVDVEYISRKYPNMKTLITDNILMMGSSKANHRFWLYEISEGEIKLASGCDKYNELITDDMLRFTCDYIREIPNNFNTVGCLTSTVYKMIMKGFNL
ncbi:MAG: hypothetical protein E6182_10085 [Clostridioides difficile]|nr:hypothetical protein [Clostridioides difficile]